MQDFYRSCKLLADRHASCRKNVSSQVYSINLLAPCYLYRADITLLQSCKARKPSFKFPSQSQSYSHMTFVLASNYNPVHLLFLPALTNSQSVSCSLAINYRPIYRKRLLLVSWLYQLPQVILISALVDGFSVTKTSPIPSSSRSGSSFRASAAQIRSFITTTEPLLNSHRFSCVLMADLMCHF
ncbi:hypothetical protein BDZ97DRAFT_659102 [Flammula alnicola]|nr:hypothetical protein BDZ97DRAFT_659102 [Flammula alnicola]